MKNIKAIIMAALAALALSSCVKNEIVPDFTQKSVAFAKEKINVSKQGETQVVAITATTDWTLSVDQEWVKLAPMSGTSATKSITVTVDEENNTDDIRVAKVIIASAADLTQTDTLLVSQTNVEAGGKIVDAETFLLFLEAAGSFTEADVVEIAEDVDMGGAEITPAAKFAGVLEGNNHSIYNFVVNSTLTGSCIFVENAGTIKNLKVGTKDGSTYDKVTKFTFASGTEANAAGIVAINSGVMENVSNYATVDFNASSPSTSDTGIGGVAGMMSGSEAKLVNCHNYGQVVFTGTLNYRGSIGGVLGLNPSAGAGVVGCVNHADVIQASKTQKEFAMGGVVGRANDKVIVTDCTNEGAVSYTCSEKPGSYLHIAGIIGAEYKASEITGCVNKGAISSCIDQVNRMGGIVGTANSGGTVASCRNEAGLTLSQPTNANWQSVGGIVGFEEKCAVNGTEGIFKDNVNNGQIVVTIDNATTHANQTCAGGIIGITCSVTQITGNVNKGSLSMTNVGGANSYVGGICGWDKTLATVLEDNENSADVTLSALAGAAGGIIGNSSVATSSIKNNANTGAVKGLVAGSIAGTCDAAITSCSVGGSVNGTVLTESNFNSYIQGAGKGSPVSCFFPGGSGPKDFVAANPMTVTFVAAGASSDVNVNSNCEWTAVSSAEWLTLSVASGNENATVTLTAAANEAKTERTATVTFTSKNDASIKAEVAVSQAGKVDGLAGNKITSAADLKAFLALAPDAAESDVYTLEADVDYSAETLIPAASFAGTLDGKGHTITLKAESGEYANYALIQILTGKVQNLTVAGSVKTTFAGEGAVAGIVARIQAGGSIYNCVNNAVITDAATGCGSVYNYVAGVVATFAGDGASVKKCTNNGKLVVTNDSQLILGGVVAYGITDAATPTLVMEELVCTSDIDINHTGANWDYVGGIVGKMGASKNPFATFTLKNCRFTGNLNIIKAPKTRGGGMFGSCGVSNAYDVSGNEFAGTVNITSTEAVDRLIGGVGPGFSEAGAIGTVSNCVFNGTINAVDGGNLYLGGIYGNNGSASVVIDGCKTTKNAAIKGYTTFKSVGMIAARPNAAGFTVKNCKVAGTVVTADGEITISADNIADWMFKGTLTAVDVTLEGNGYNAE